MSGRRMWTCWRGDHTLFLQNMREETVCVHPDTHRLEHDGCAIIGFTMKYQERITITPGKRSGKPCIHDTRITVYEILEYLASGMSEEQIIDEFPELEKDDIRAAFLFAADRERKLTTIDA